MKDPMRYSTNQEVAQHLIETAEERVVTATVFEGRYYEGASVWRCCDCGKRMIGRRFFGNPGTVILQKCPLCGKYARMVHAPAPEGYLFIVEDEYV